MQAEIALSLMRVTVVPFKGTMCYMCQNSSLKCYKNNSNYQQDVRKKMMLCQKCLCIVLQRYLQC